MQGNPVSLADLQRSFCAALRSSGRPPQLLLDQLLDDGLALQRFNVYRNNFVVLNGDALADMYPVIKRLVGDSAFRLLASAYVRRHPPVQRTLLLYGDRFADFLAAIPELSEFPYLPDVARNFPGQPATTPKMRHLSIAPSWLRSTPLHSARLVWFPIRPCSACGRIIRCCVYGRVISRERRERPFLWMLVPAGWY